MTSSIDVPGSQQITRLTMMEPIPIPATTAQILLNLIATKEEGESVIWKIVVRHNVEYTATYLQIHCQRIIEQKKNGTRNGH